MIPQEIYIPVDSQELADEEEKSYFVQGLPEMSNLAYPKDMFWKTEMQYNGFDSK